MSSAPLSGTCRSAGATQQPRTCVVLGPSPPSLGGGPRLGPPLAGAGGDWRHRSWQGVVLVALFLQRRRPGQLPLHGAGARRPVLIRQGLKLKHRVDWRAVGRPDGPGVEGRPKLAATDSRAGRPGGRQRRAVVGAAARFHEAVHLRDTGLATGRSVLVAKFVFVRGVTCAARANCAR